VIKSGSRVVGFCGHAVTINAYGAGAEAMIDFLCCDLPADSDARVQASYDLMCTGDEPMLSLWLEGTCIYSGNCKYDLAYALINEIIYQCIVDNSAGQAIHAAAISSTAGAVLLPGKSGSGKSTLTTWLVSKGCNYLTDELVLLGEGEQRLYPFTRPFSIKSGSAAVLSSLLKYAPSEILSGVNGFMLPHRLVNPHFSAVSPAFSLILFPKYEAGAPTSLIPLPSALGCAQLMECYVNARNFQDHGIGQLADFTRNTPAYQLTYSSFTGLYELLNDSFSELFS